jgi:3-deoxy-D-manno-octulosonic-acid transferase
MGESQSVLPLIEALLKEHENLHILVTTGTVTSAKNMASRLPERAFHQYVPVDLEFSVGQFLSHWKPDMVFWVESELWPNLLLMTKEQQIPVILLNGRISRQSAERWHRWPDMIAQILSCFSLILAKSDEDASRFRNLGALQVRSEGNLKFSAPALDADPKITAEIVGKIGDRPAWLAASTHQGEEEIAGEIHKQLSEQFPSLLTVIVPRHNTRGAEIAASLEEKKLNVAQRSKDEAITHETDVYVADTMGELGVFYRIAGIAFVGGSLVPHGGQNPFEPARLDCAILYGPHMENCRELELSHAAIRVKDQTELAEKLEELLRDHEKQEELAKAALTAVKEKNEVLGRVQEVIAPYVRLRIDEANEHDTTESSAKISTRNPSEHGQTGG